GYIDRITEFDAVSALTGWHRRALLNPSPHAITQELSSRHSLFLSIDNIPLHLTRRGAGQRSILPEASCRWSIHRLESIIVHHHHDDIDEEGEKEEKASSSLSGGDERRRRRQCHLLQLSKLESNMRPAGSVSGPLSRACRILVDNEVDSELAAEEEEESLSDADEVTASHDDSSSSYSSSRYSLSGASSSNIIIDRQQQQEEEEQENATVSLRIDARHLSILRDLAPDRARTEDMIDKSRELPEEDACWIDITALKGLGSYSIWSSHVITRDTIKLMRTQEDTPQYIEIQMEIDVPAGRDALTTLTPTDGVWFIAQLLHTPPEAAAAMVEGGTHDGVDSSSSAAAAAAAAAAADDDDDSVVVCIMKADGDDDNYTLNGTIHIHSDIYRAAAAAAASSSSSSCSTSDVDDNDEEKPVLLLDITDHHPGILGYQCLSRTLVHSSTAGCMRIFAESREADEGAILPGECIFRNVPLHNHHDYTLPPNGTYMLIIDTDSIEETIKSMKAYGV
ncbi:hypothetical protein FOZ62_000778, partial [Perkinsus olseni]